MGYLSSLTQSKHNWIHSFLKKPTLEKMQKQDWQPAAIQG
jgi:hypothetical protein